MKKCDFCYDRLTNPDLLATPFVSADGLTKSAKPSCQVTCPPGAITSGSADTMLNKAKKRVTSLISQGYNAEIYPPQDGTWPHGKTRVIWVLTESRTVYGL
jgi:Fe-S-cluster-containing dehydrogenase component